MFTKEVVTIPQNSPFIDEPTRILMTQAAKQIHKLTTAAGFKEVMAVLPLECNIPKYIVTIDITPTG